MPACHILDTIKLVPFH